MNKENYYIFTYKECQLLEEKYKLDFPYYVGNKLRSECDECKSITDNDVLDWINEEMAKVENLLKKYKNKKMLKGYYLGLEKAKSYFVCREGQ
ncbi:hypothetical protein [Spiroplasma endosymbiont of Villa modesta]|uniref:hypothetical protein n=1 Tax=Spiroplasma endosymbiont of Villa modesta TaxID=3066293 RepID=UPI00313CFDBA